MKNLSKRLYELTLFWPFALFVMCCCTAKSSAYAHSVAVPGTTTFTVGDVLTVRRGFPQSFYTRDVEVEIEPSLIIRHQIIYHGRHYTQQAWCAFFVRNLLSGPDSNRITNVKFSLEPPDPWLIETGYSTRDPATGEVVDVSITDEGSTAIVSCPVIGHIDVEELHDHVSPLFDED